MSFMQLELIEDQAYLVDTDNGIEHIPAHIVGILEGLSPGDTIDDDSELWPDACSLLRDYLESTEEPNSIELSKPGYVGRYQAPGYMDSTPWTYSANRRELTRDLKDLYGSDD